MVGEINVSSFIDGTRKHTYNSPLVPPFFHLNNFLMDMLASASFLITFPTAISKSS